MWNGEGKIFTRIGFNYFIKTQQIYAQVYVILGLETTRSCEGEGGMAVLRKVLSELKMAFLAGMEGGR